MVWEPHTLLVFIEPQKALRFQGEEVLSVESIPEPCSRVVLLF